MNGTICAFCHLRMHASTTLSYTVKSFYEMKYSFSTDIYGLRTKSTKSPFSSTSFAAYISFTKHSTPHATYNLQLKERSDPIPFSPEFCEVTVVHRSIDCNKFTISMKTKFKQWRNYFLLESHIFNCRLLFLVLLLGAIRLKYLHAGIMPWNLLNVGKKKYGMCKATKIHSNPQNLTLLSYFTNWI